LFPIVTLSAFGLILIILIAVLFKRRKNGSHD
jgi:LPXTG-motif cell wall-anchored protein